MTPLDTLKALRRSYPTPMSKDQLGALMNALAWAHRDDGYGVLAKPTGNNCRQPQTGTLIACDLLARPDGRIIDVLIASDTRAEPTWGTNKKPVAANRWRAPVDPLTVAPPVVEPPPVVRPSQPYPDEPIWWTELLDDMQALYDRAGQPFDRGGFKWSARIAYDIGAGLPKEVARVKHLEELRTALGLR